MVMAREDIVWCCVMWLETRDWKFIGNRIVPVIVHDEYPGQLEFFDCITDEIYSCDREDYNIHWRVWTEEPTDEQRRETPWN